MADSEPPRKKLKVKERKIIKSKKIVEDIYSCPTFLKYQMSHRTLGFYNVPSSWTKKWYTSLKCLDKVQYASTDAIFNLEFSPDGKYLVAACENSDITLFDPCIHKKLHSVNNAHKDSVNCISFLDTITFASCSDDKTVSLWDVRNLKENIVNLKGHSSWVKSIHYCSKTRQLISSAFDDTVRTWNVNENYKNGEVKSNKVLNVPYLTRTKISHDASQMFVATTTGFLFIIHNLNLKTLKLDTKEELHNLAASFNPRKSKVPFKDVKNTNTIEFLNDYPSDSKPWCIASIQIHPSGNTILSRYTNQNASSEWSVIHDTQPDTGPLFLKMSRLQSYIEEPNLASGFIKELCYNQDGRIICSPFGNSIRLLAYDRNCNDLVECYQNPSPLIEIGFVTSHKNSVLTTRFSPTLPILASGCLGGQVCFYQPRF